MNSERGGSIPQELIGATINAIGTPKGNEHDRPEGGGLLIEYTPSKSNRKKRILLGFNDCGMWVEKNHFGVHSG